MPPTRSPAPPPGQPPGPSSSPPVVELRRYTLWPGRRDDLVGLFDRHFRAAQEACGITVIGQFRDLDAPDRFVWLRGFGGMTERAAALTAFYEHHPAWQEHKDAANATMVDSDDVLLLRPLPDGADPTGGAGPVPVDAGPPLVVATVHHLRDAAALDAYTARFTAGIAPVLAATGGAARLLLRTEPAANTYPRLPIRTGEHVLVHVAAFPGDRAYTAHRTRLAAHPDLARIAALDDRWLIRPPERLRLRPTDGSHLR